jgi:hypothetical protein
MAMHNAALLAEENNELRLANAKQKKKRSQPNAYLAHQGILSMEQGQQEFERLAAYEQETQQPRQPKPRAAPRCSVCRSLEHNARVCPERRR